MNLPDAIKHLTNLAEGWDCGALCEDAIVARFQAELDGFSARDAESFNLRRVRAAVDARSNAASYRKDAEATRAVLAALSSQHNADAGGEAVHSSPATDEQP